MRVTPAVDPALAQHEPLGPSEEPSKLARAASIRIDHHGERMSPVAKASDAAEERGLRLRARGDPEHLPPQPCP